MAVGRIVWAGLTLILVLVVACVGLAVVWDWIDGHSHTHARVIAVVMALDKACKMYKLDYGVYPPGSPDYDSRVLIQSLGSNRKVRKGEVEVEAPPFIQFPKDWIENGRIVDSWGHAIRYRNPGRFNTKGVDIWSPGKNGKDDLDVKPEDTDDITNWIKEY